MTDLTKLTRNWRQRPREEIAIAYRVLNEHRFMRGLPPEIDVERVAMLWFLNDAREAAE